MAVTQNTYTGNGSTVLYSFTFPYLETTDIKVSVNGTVTTAYTLANATTIRFNSAPANGAAIRIYRETDDSALAATFYPGSAIRSNDLNDNFTQNLYVTQESTNNAATATTTANTALTKSNTAISTANSAVSTANTASSNASAAVATANTASSNASAAVSTANTASSNATTAVNTANAATATANSAASDAATAISTANTAVSTANTASTAATNAVNTANAATSTASSAVSTANTASTNASNAVSTANSAVTTANNAVSTANSAVTTANSADSKADQAIAAVANALLFTIVANVAAIPGSPSDGDAIEITDSTGIENFTPLSGTPAGFVGDSGLGVRLVYDGTGATWVWLQYFPQDPDNRYAGPNTAVGSAAAPSIAFGPTDANTGIYSPGADQLALSTNGTQRLLIDASGNVNIDSNTLYVDATNNRVGIGNSNPLNTLVVQGPSSDGTSSSGQVAEFCGPGRVNGWVVFVNDTNNNSGIQTRSGDAFLINPNGGNVGIGDDGPDSKLTVKAATGVTPFKVSGPSSEFAKIDTSGRLLIGTSSVTNLFSAASPRFPANEMVNGAGVNDRQTLLLRANSTTASGPQLSFLKNKAADSTCTLVADDDELGVLNFYGADGTDFATQGASIGAYVDGTPGSNDMPGRLVFSTTADEASSPTERMRIDSNGTVTIWAGRLSVGDFYIFTASGNLNNGQALAVTFGSASATHRGQNIFRINYCVHTNNSATLYAASFIVNIKDSVTTGYSLSLTDFQSLYNVGATIGSTADLTFVDNADGTARITFPNKVGAGGNSSNTTAKVTVERICSGFNSTMMPTAATIV